MSRFLKNFFWDKIRIENLTFLYNWCVATQHGINSPYSYHHSWKNCWWPFLPPFPIPVWFDGWGRRSWGSPLLWIDIVNVVYKTLPNVPQTSLPLLNPFWIFLKILVHIAWTAKLTWRHYLWDPLVKTALLFWWLSTHALLFFCMCLINCQLITQLLMFGVFPDRYSIMWLLLKLKMS